MISEQLLRARLYLQSRHPTLYRVTCTRVSRTLLAGTLAIALIVQYGPQAVRWAYQHPVTCIAAVVIYLALTQLDRTVRWFGRARR